MDLSAIIFVVLALAWAVYLIPKALKHHDEVAAEHLDEGHSERARVLSRRRTPAAEPVQAPAPTAAPVASAESTLSSEQSSSSEQSWSVEQSSSVEPVETPRPELSAAGRAARNRRRVLALLLSVLAVVWVATWFAYLPAITPLWPTLAVVGWLVLARVSVIRMQRTRRTVRVAAPEAPVEAAPVEARVEARVESPAPAPRAEVPAEPFRVDGFDERPEVVAEQQALADDGALWDPLPLTLPTYVGKATARRTVRTIELTGVTSSGHDAADSALAREADATRPAASEESEQRRAAGA